MISSFHASLFFLNNFMLHWEKARKVWHGVLFFHQTDITHTLKKRAHTVVGPGPWPGWPSLALGRTALMRVDESPLQMTPLMRARTSLRTNGERQCSCSHFFTSSYVQEWSGGVAQRGGLLALQPTMTVVV
jgi:hypothetical protein